MVLDFCWRILVFILGTLVGFVLPGLGLSRRFSSPIPACTTFLISILNLFLVTLIYQLLGLPIQFLSLFPSLAFLSILCLYLGRQGSVSGLTISDWKAHRGIALLIGALCLLMLIRTTMWPLSGADTSFRWNLLATQIFKRGHYNYYPPQTSADFELYPMVDAIPPLISICYYWIYECCSGVFPRATSVFVTVQYVLTISVIFSCAKYMKNRAAGHWAAAIFSSSELSFWAIGMGQETGILGLSMVGSLSLLTRVQRKNARALTILAACVTAVGMLSREYGGIIVISGAVVLYFRQVGWRSLIFYVALSFLLCGAWYLRTWVLTGNPFYSIRTVTFFPVHERYDAMMSLAKSRQWFNFGSFIDIAKELTIICGLPIIFGLPFMFSQVKSRPYFLIVSILLGVVWFVSVGHTSLWQYSLRALQPLCVVLCVGGGMTVHHLHKSRLVGAILPFIIVAVMIGNFIDVSVFPYRLRFLPKASVYQKLSSPIYQENRDFISPVSIRNMLRRKTPGTKVVAHSYYYFSQMFRLEIPVISQFSPAADILYSRDEDITNGLRELKRLKIGMIVVPKERDSDFEGTLLNFIILNNKNLAEQSDSVEIYPVD